MSDKAKQDQAQALAETLSHQVQVWVRCQMVHRGLSNNEYAALVGIRPTYLSELLHAKDLSLRNIYRLTMPLGGVFVIGLKSEDIADEPCC